MSDKTFIKKIDGFNIYSVPDSYGRTVLAAYLNRQKIAEEMYIVTEPDELEMAYQHLISIAKRAVTRT